MSSLNKALIVGNLGRDPEIRAMSNGDRVCNLSVATSETWTKNDTKYERVEWHRVVIYNQQLIPVAEKYLRKGSKVLLEGRIETRKWSDQSGVERYSTEIVLRNFDAKLVLLGDPRGMNGQAAADKAGHGAAHSVDATSQAPLDDEIPF